MLQNRSSAAESAHANTEASVSGHRLDRRQENEMGKQKTGSFFESGRKWDLEYFYEIGMILRLKQHLELS